MNSRYWKADEIEYLRSVYGDIPTDDIAYRLGRPVRAIRLQACRLSLGPAFKIKAHRLLLERLRAANTADKTSREICQELSIGLGKFYGISSLFNIPFKRFRGRRGLNRINLLHHDIRLKQYNENRLSIHHLDGNPENDSPKNRIEIQQGVHFVAHQVVRNRRAAIVYPSFFFIGKAGTGKTTWADYLVTKYGYVRKSFAKRVKDIAVNDFGMGDKDRRLLQIIGRTGRAIDPFLWTKILVDELSGRVAVDDCRFLNEFLVLKLLGMKAVFLECDADIRAERVGTVGGEDVSETELESLTPWADLIMDTSQPMSINGGILDSFYEVVMGEEDPK